MKTKTTNAIPGRSLVRSLFRSAPPQPRADSDRRANTPMTKSEIQRLFARELGYARDFSASMQQPALRHAAR